jgi:hypothetical protein
VAERRLVQAADPVRARRHRSADRGGAWPRRRNRP